MYPVSVRSLGPILENSIRLEVCGRTDVFTVLVNRVEHEGNRIIGGFVLAVVSLA